MYIYIFQNVLKFSSAKFVGLDVDFDRRILIYSQVHHQQHTKINDK